MTEKVLPVEILREKVAQWLYYYYYPQSAPSGWRKVNRAQQENWRNSADQLLSELAKLNVAVLAKPRFIISLPPLSKKCFEVLSLIDGTEVK